MPGLTGMPESCQQLKHKKVFTVKLLSCSAETKSASATTTCKTWITTLKGALARFLHLHEMLVVMLASSSAFIC